MRRTFLLILFAALLAGCSLAPTYTRPEAPVPAAWPDAGQAAVKPGEAAADVPWQDFFVDERLRQVINLALSNNRDLRVAALNVQRTQALYRIQRAELLPTVDARGTFSKERVPGILSQSGQPATVELYNVNLGVSSWEIDLFGRIRNLKDAALEQYLATEQARASAQMALVAAVANTCLTLAADRENLDARPIDPRDPAGDLRDDTAARRGRRLLRSRPAPGPDPGGRGSGGHRPVHEPGGPRRERPDPPGRLARSRPNFCPMR